MTSPRPRLDPAKPLQTCTRVNKRRRTPIRSPIYPIGTVWGCYYPQPWRLSDTYTQRETRGVIARPLFCVVRSEPLFGIKIPYRRLWRGFLSSCVPEFLPARP
jgi:hypothetical protein